MICFKNYDKIGRDKKLSEFLYIRGEAEDGGEKETSSWN